MVFLKNLKQQYPWNPNAPEDYSDKEIYTHRVSIEDASNVWRVPVLPPLNGFAFVGMRVSVYGKDTNYSKLSFCKEVDDTHIHIFIHNIIR